MASNVRPLDPDAFTFFGFGDRQEPIAAHIRSGAQIRFGDPGLTVVEDAIFIPAVKQQTVGQPDYAGGILAANGDIVEAAQLRRGRDKLIGGLSGAIQVADAPALDEDVIHLGWLYAHFGRFLLESLARVWPLATLDPSLRVVFHHAQGARRAVPAWAFSLLEAFGIPPRRLLALAEPTRVRRALVPEPLFQQHHAAHMAMARPFRDVAMRFADGGAPSAQPVYLSRSRLSSRQRAIVGEDDVEALLRENGFRIAYPEQLSLAEQIRLINGHADIFSSAGSAAHNVLFALGRPRLHLLTTDAGPPINYYLCSALAQTPTTLVNCLTTGGRPNVKRQQSTPSVVEMQRLTDYLVAQGFARRAPRRNDGVGSRQRQYDETWLYARIQRCDCEDALPAVIEQEAVRLAATSWPLSLALAWRYAEHDAAAAAPMAERFVALAAVEPDARRIAFFRADVMRLAPRIGRRCGAPLDKRLAALVRDRFAGVDANETPPADRARPTSSNPNQEFIAAPYRDAAGWQPHSAAPLRQIRPARGSIVGGEIFGARSSERLRTVGPLRSEESMTRGTNVGSTAASASPGMVLAAGGEMLTKVPEVTISFWLIKVLCTTVGETAADYLNVNLNLGLTGTTWAMGALLLLVLFVQFRTRRYVPAIYWLAVVLLSVVGTLITDNLTDNLGVSLVTTTFMFSVALAATFVAWHASERTLSIHTIVTTRREAFYWLAILFTFALGTAAGDLTAERLNLGYPLSALLFAALIAVLAIAHLRMRLNPVLAFWLAYILTRPLGASLGDLLAQPREAGGLGLGAPLTSALFLGAIVLVVIYLTVTRADASSVASARARFGSAALPSGSGSD